MRGDCVAFASHWQLHNYRILTESGPLWVVLGDSTAQGLGAPSPEGGYVGQVLAELRQRTGQRWRVLNLSTSGALIRDVLHDQLPRLPAAAGPGDLRDRRERHPVHARRPSCSPTCARCWPPSPTRPSSWTSRCPAGCGACSAGISVPYVARINRTIHEPAAAARPAGRRGVSTHFRAALGREVRVGLLPPEPGRVPRLGPAPCWRRSRPPRAGGSRFPSADRPARACRARACRAGACC